MLFKKNTKVKKVLISVLLSSTLTIPSFAAIQSDSNMAGQDVDISNADNGFAVVGSDLILFDNSNDVIRSFRNNNGVMEIDTNGLTAGGQEAIILNNGNTAGEDISLGSNDANNLIIETNDIERLRVLSTGNIGIGTTSPDADLDIEGSENTELLRLTDTTSGDSAGFFIGTGTPEAQVAAQLGSIYIDHNVGDVYIKRADDGLNTGWETFTVTSGSGFATRELSNLQNVAINDDLNPDGNNTRSLGSSTERWQDLFLGPNSLDIGSDGDSGVLSYNTASNEFQFDQAVEITSGNMQVSSGDLQIDTGNITVSAGNIEVSSGVIELGNGSAALPSYSFTSNPDTGLFTDGVEMGLSVGGTQRMHFDQLGNIAIGNNNPQADLHISGLENNEFIRMEDITNADHASIFVGSGTPNGSVAARLGSLYLDHANGDLYLKETSAGFSTGWSEITPVTGVIRTDGTTQMDNDAQLRIDDGSPAAPAVAFKADLDTGIAQSSAGTMQFVLNGTEEFSLGVSNSSLGSSLALTGSISTSNVENIPSITLNDTTNTDSVSINIGNAQPNGVSTGQIGSLFIDHANADLYFKANSDGATTGWIEIPVEDDVLLTDGSNFMNIGSQLVIDDGNAAAPALRFRNDVDTGLFSSASNIINFATNGTERMSIDSLGRVNTSSSMDVGTTLDTGGTVTVTKVQNTPFLTLSDSTNADTASLHTGSGNPTGSVLGQLGSLYLDHANGDLYLKSTGDNQNFGWELVATQGNVLLLDGSSSMDNGAQIEADEGSAAAPGITFSGDEDTGIAGDGTDDLLFATGGSERMRINNLGNVGIGTSTADEPLHIAEAVNGNSALVLLENSLANAAASVNETADISFGFGGVNDAARIRVAKDSDYSTIANQDSRIDFLVDVNGTLNQQLTVAGAGVGVNTTSPDANLDIEDSNNSEFIRLTSSTVADSIGMYLGSGSPESVVTAQLGSIYFDRLNGDIFAKASGDDTNTGWFGMTTDLSGDFSNNGDIAGANRDIGNNDDFDLGIETNGTQRILIQNSGEVAINDTTANAMLEVNGSGFATTDLLRLVPDGGLANQNVVFDEDGKLTIGSNSSQGIPLSIVSSEADSDPAMLISSATSDAAIRYTNGQSGASLVNYVMGLDNSDTDSFKISRGAGASGEAVLGTNTSFKLTSSGNTGIGEWDSNNPDAKLHFATDDTSSTVIFENSNAAAIGVTNHAINLDFGFGGSNQVGRIQFGKEADFTNAANQDSFMAFSTSQNSASGAERMRIDSNGTLLIGNTSSLAGAAIRANGDIVPHLNNSLSLGTDTLRFSDAFLGPASLHIGNSGDEAVISFDTGNNDLEIDQALTVSGDTTVSTGDLSISSGAVLAPNNGAAASPEYSFNSDTDTGFFNPTANTIALATLGIERLRVDSTGELGIGTTSPDADLDIEGAENTELIRLSDSTNTDSIGFFVGSGTPNGFVNGQLGSLYFDHAAGDVYAKISNDGASTGWSDITAAAAGSFANDTLDNLQNVAINTSLISDTNNADDLGSDTIRWGDLFVGSGSVHIGTSTADEATISYNTGANELVINEGGLDTNFRIESDATINTFFLDASTSQIGINNSAPSSALDVTGDIEASGTLTVSPGSTAAPSLTFATDTDTGLFRPSINIVGITAAGIERARFSSSGIIFNEGATDVDFRVEGTSAANLLHVDAGVNRVGINTANPAAILDVNGTGFAGTDIFRLTTNGLQTAELIRVDEDGKIGMGTSPGDPKVRISGGDVASEVTVELNTTASDAAIRYAGSSFGTPISFAAGLDQTDNHFKISRASGAGTAAILGTNNSLIIQNSGRIGLGEWDSNSPDSGLHYADSDTQTNLILENTNTAAAGVTSHTVDLNFGFDGSNSVGKIRLGKESDFVAAADRDSFMAFFTSQNSTAGTERMRIDSNGTLLIGNTTSLSSAAIRANGDIVPHITNNAELGTNTLRWNELYLDSLNSLHIGTNGDEAVFNYDTGGDDLELDHALTITNGDTTISNGNLIVNTGTLFVPNNGAAASPEYSFNSDTDTGIFNPLSNQIAFSTLGTERMRINASGNIGIGTTSPDADLDIEAAENTEFIRFTDSTNSDSVSFYTGNASPNGAVFAQLGSFFLDSANGDAYIKASGDGTSSGWQELLAGTGNFASTALDNLASVAINTDLLPDTNDTHDLGSSALRWADVFVGPASLHIGANGDDGTIGYNTTTNEFQFDQGLNVSSGDLTLTAGDSLTQDGSVAAPGHSFASDETSGMFLAASGRLGIAANGIEGIRINQLGQVGIGTTTPEVKLDVEAPETEEHIRLTDSTNADAIGMFTGGGTPEGVILAELGSIYFDHDNGDIYAKASGNNTNTGWAELSTANGNFATTALDNLASVAINTDLLPDTNDTHDLGSNTLRWADVFVGPASLHIGSSGNDGTLSYNTATSEFQLDHGINISSGDLTLGSGIIEIPSGTAAAPSLTFTGDPNTGIFRNTVDTMSLVAAGVARLTANTAGVTIPTLSSTDATSGTFSSTTAFRANDGSATTPSYSFTNDPNTGIFRNTVDTMSLVAAGVPGLTINGTGVTIPTLNATDATSGTFSSTTAFRANDGTSSLPSYSFTGDTNTGIFRNTVDTMSLVAAGVSGLTINGTGVTIPTLNSTNATSGTFSSTTAFRANDGSASVPSISFTSDANTGIFRSTIDTMNFATTGVERFEFGTNEAVFNDVAQNYDLRIEGNSDTDLLLIDASANRIGISTNSPDALLDIEATANTEFLRFTNTTNADSIGFYTGVADPEGLVTAQPGSIYSDSNNGLLYLKNTGISNTGWLELSTSGAAAPSLLIDGNSEGATIAAGTNDNNNFELETNNSTRMVIEAAGDIGIGIADPDKVLHIQEASTTQDAIVEIEQTSSGDATLQFSTQGESFAVGIDNGSNEFAISYAASEGTAVLGTNNYMVIENDGEVGFGTDSPLTNLHIHEANTDTTPMLRLQNQSTIGDAGMQLTIANRAYSIAIDNSDSDSLKISSSPTTGSAEAGTNDIITFEGSTQDIGIGTTSPDVKLHIAEAVNGNSFPLLIQNTEVSADTSTNETAEIRFGFDTNNDVARIVVGKESDYFGAASDHDSFMAFFTDFNATDTERMRIESDGDVLIGTTTSNGEGVLQVDGNIVPDSNDTDDLGAESFRWRDLYLGPDTLHIGTASGDEGSISYNTTSNILLIESTEDITFNGTASGVITFNEISADTDFRIESDNNANMFFVDASNNSIGINTNTPDALVDIQSADDQEYIRLTTTTTTDSVGIFMGSGTPESIITANGGSLYLDRTGGDLYVKESSTGNTGWSSAATGDFLPRDGSSPMTGQLELVSANTPATPALTFTGDTDTGIYHSTTNAMSFATAGVERMTINSSGNIALSGNLQANGSNNTLAGATFTDQLIAATGNNTLPSYTFSGDTDTGMYHPSTNVLGFSTAGVQRMSINSSGVVSITGTLNSSSSGHSLGATTFTDQITVASGTPSSPSYAFISDSDTGMYRNTTNSLAFSTAATQRMSINSSGDVTINNNLTVGNDINITAGDLTVPTGLETSPTINFTGDPNTGIYRATTDTIGLVAGGVERLRANNSSMTINNGSNNYDFIVRTASATDTFVVDGSANAVGIGLTTPQTLLHVQESNTAESPLIEIENTGSGDGAIQFTAGTDSYAMGVDNSDGDKFKISFNTTIGTATLGTNDRFTISNNGNIGMGSGGTNPDEILHIAEASTTDQVLLLLENSQANTDSQVDETAQIRFGFGGDNDAARIVAGKVGDYLGTTADFDSFLAFYTDLNGTAIEAMRIDEEGEVGIGITSPAEALDVSGNIQLTGSIIETSDARVKENVNTVENALEKILALRGVTYTRNDLNDNKTYYGVIAQEVEEVIPELVNTNKETGYKGVNYDGFAAPLIEAVKEQQVQINSLKEENEELKAELNEIKQILLEIKSEK